LGKNAHSTSGVADHLALKGV